MGGGGSVPPSDILSRYRLVSFQPWLLTDHKESILHKNLEVGGAVGETVCLLVIYCPGTDQFNPLGLFMDSEESMFERIMTWEGRGVYLFLLVIYYPSTGPFHPCFNLPLHLGSYFTSKDTD